MNRPNLVLLLATLIALLAISTKSPAQANRESLVNPAPTGSHGMIGGRPGSSAGRTQRKPSPRVNFGTSDPSNFQTQAPRLERRIPSTVPDERFRDSSEFVSPYVGRAGGITIDESIEVFVKNNLDLLQNREEITQAEADYITAGLRSNPIAYVDTQGVPYGRYTDKTTGGPKQYDFNIVYPVDFSHKRQARMASALLSKRAVETKFEDVVRLAIDNLYASYIDALVAQRNVEFHDRQFRDIEPSDVTKIQVDDASETYDTAFENLAVLLSMPLETLKRRGLFGRISYERDEEPPIPTEDELVQEALACRPDLVSQRIVVCRAIADISVVQTSRFDDAQLLVQPLTYYNGISPNAPQSSMGWAIGLTIPLPIYNRQQGNILKAQSIASQVRLQTASMERTVEAEVRRAVRRHQFSLLAVEKIVEDKQRQDGDDLILRLQKRFRDNGTQPDPDLLQLVGHLEKLVSSNEEDQLKKIDELTVQHRRSMLKLNTVVGRRILP